MPRHSRSGTCQQELCQGYVPTAELGLPHILHFTDTLTGFVGNWAETLLRLNQDVDLAAESIISALGGMYWGRARLSPGDYRPPPQYTWKVLLYPFVWPFFRTKGLILSLCSFGITKLFYNSVPKADIALEGRECLPTYPCSVTCPFIMLAFEVLFHKNNFRKYNVDHSYRGKFRTAQSYINWVQPTSPHFSTLTL